MLARLSADGGDCGHVHTCGVKRSSISHCVVAPRQRPGHAPSLLAGLHPLSWIRAEGWQTAEDTETRGLICVIGGRDEAGPGDGVELEKENERVHTERV